MLSAVRDLSERHQRRKTADGFSLEREENKEEGAAVGERKGFAVKNLGYVWLLE